MTLQWIYLKPFFLKKQDYLIIFVTLHNINMYYKVYGFDSYWLSWQYLILKSKLLHVGEEPELDTDIYAASLKFSNTLKWLGLLCHDCPNYIFSRSPTYLQDVSLFFYKECVVIFLLEIAQFSPFAFSLPEFLKHHWLYRSQYEFYSGLLVSASKF